MKRDAVDARVVNDVKNGTGAIIDDEDEVGSWPAYNTYDIKTDSDKDGMPDEWEMQNKLDPNNSEDRNNDPNNDGYTNLEVYLNNLSGASLTVGTNEIKREQTISIYPNPNNGLFSVNLSNTGNSQIEIFDSANRLIYNKKRVTGIHEIDLKNGAGMYFLKVIDGNNNISTRKVLINSN